MGATASVEVVRSVPLVSERWLLEEEGVAETPLHDHCIDLLKLILLAWVARRALDASVHRNIAVRWDRARPNTGVDPDLCVVTPALPADATSLCLWEPGSAPPRLAVEVVSEGTADKDYLDNPDRYAACGAGEIWVFDPMRFGPSTTGGPFTLQVWRRDRHGRFVQTYAGDGPAYSDALSAWLVVTDGGTRLRVADDEEGASLWPTREEEALAREREALDEVARLRAELERLRDG
ncbi:MAG: Uma2 family endonuclease [Polyangiales bacterium]